MLPHTPHNLPVNFWAKYSQLTVNPWPVIANFAWLDLACGQLRDDLDTRGLRDNTIIFFVCDNGSIQDPAGVHRDAERSKPYAVSRRCRHTDHDLTGIDLTNEAAVANRSTVFGERYAEAACATNPAAVLPAGPPPITTTS